MKQRALVLGAVAWDFEDEKSGKPVEIYKLTYTSGSPTCDSNRKGCESYEVKVSSQVYKQLGTLPGVYDLELETRIVRRQPVLTVVEADFVKQLSLRQLLADENGEIHTRPNPVFAGAAAK